MIRERAELMEVLAGIDVGKGSLEVWAGAGPARRFPNSAEGITALVSWLALEGIAGAVCEPTGGYEREVMRRFEEAGLRAHRVHPNKVRAFARASGYEAKTDAQDAQTLFRFGQVFALAATSQEPSDPQRAQLQDLLRRRRQLVNQRVQERNRLDKGLTAASRDSTQRHIAWLDQEIDRLDQEYQKALQSSRELSHRADLYRSVPGGATTHCSYLGGGPAGAGAGGRQEVDFFGGLGSLVKGQRPTAGLPGHPGWPGDGTPSLVPGGPLGGAKQGQCPGAFLPAAPPTGQARQGSFGGIDAKTALTTPRRRPPRNTLGN